MVCLSNAIHMIPYMCTQCTQLFIFIYHTEFIDCLALIHRQVSPKAEVQPSSSSFSGPQLLGEAWCVRRRSGKPKPKDQGITLLDLL